MKPKLVRVSVFAMSLAWAANGATAAIIHDVTVGPGGALVFLPDALVIDIGDTVRWTWDSDGHNVGSGLPGFPTPAFLSGPPAVAGTVFEVVDTSMWVTMGPRPNVLADLTNAMRPMNIDITHAEYRPGDEGDSVFVFVFQAQDTAVVERLAKLLRTVSGVRSVASKSVARDAGVA